MTKGIVLIACGSFNPVTKMHLAMFELAKNYLEKNQYSLVKGFFSPVHDSYFIKKGALVSSKIRSEMIEIAIDEFNKEKNIKTNYLFCDQWESKQADWSRTINVLKHFESLVKKEESLETTKLKLLCGADFLESMTKKDIWNEEDIEEIIENYGLFVLTRHGFDAMKIINNNSILKKYSYNIIVTENTIGLEHSSTKVRQAIKNNDSTSDLLYDKVYQFIKRNNLYI